jgi:DNA-binding response OmpR family regulator
VSAASRRFLDQTGTGWLSKPFDISGIERLVKNHLRSASAETVQRMG